MLQALINLPFVHPRVVAPSLEGCLARLGYRARSQVEHVGVDQAQQALQASMSEAGLLPGWPRSLVWRGYSHPVAGQGVVAELGGRWDLRLARCLSAACGCFALAYESGRVLGYHGCALFHAGHTITAWGEDANVAHPGIALGLAQPGGNALRISDAWMSTIANASLTDSNWCETTMSHLISLQPPETPFDPYTLDVATEPHVARAAIAGVDEQSFQDVYDALPARIKQNWHWRIQYTAGAEISYVVLERQGVLDSEFLIRLAQHLRCHAAGVELGLPDEAIPWVWVDPDGERRIGRANSVETYVAVWRDLAATMGATPGEIIWPQSKGRINSS